MIPNSGLGMLRYSAKRHPWPRRNAKPLRQGWLLLLRLAVEAIDEAEHGVAGYHIGVVLPHAAAVHARVHV